MTRHLVFAITVLVLATTLIAITGADLKISSLFCINGAWPVGDQFFWHLLYQLDRIPSIALGVSGLIAALYGYYQPSAASWRKKGVFLLLLLILGPGVLTNVIFKEYWGRPRPREIIQFSGAKQFLQPWQRGIPHNGRSFPSGHSSAAFYMAAPYFIFRNEKRKIALLWLAGGMIFGILMSIARIAQGGHFLSDCLWAWGVVYLCAIALYSGLKLNKHEIS